MDDKNFDKLISDALKDFKADYDSSNWSQFESRMESGIDPESVQFDHMVKDKLASYSVPLNPSHWDIFDEQLSHSLYDNYASELDVAVKQNLGNLSVPYDEETWPILEQKIEARKAYIRKLIFTKSIEAAIVIFAIFTFYTYFPLYQQQYKNWKSEKNQFVQQNKSESLDNASNADELSNLNHNVTQEYRESGDAVANRAQANQHQNSKNLEKEFILTKNSDLILKPNENSKGERIARVPQVPSHQDESGVSRIEENFIKELPSIVQNVKQYNSIPPELQNRKHLEDLAIATAKSYSEDSKISLRLDKKAIKKLSSSPVAFVSTNQLPVTFNDFEQTKKKRTWRLGIHGSTDLNFVNIPQDKYTDYHQKKLTTFNESDLTEFGAGAGLSLNVNFGKLSVETGVHYSNKSYDPNKNYIPDPGYSQIDYKQINMDIVEIPLNVHYYLQNERRLKYYVVAGVAVNAIAISDHDLIIPRPAFLGQPRTSQENFEVSRVKSHFLQSDADRNVFFTANLGVGVEYQISEQYSIYAEPIYKQQFLTKGIGPNEDKINSASLKIGSRMTF